MITVRNDLTGKTFGRLQVLYQVDDYISPNGNHAAKWRCKCSCEQHNVVDILGRRLTQKKNPTRSCGCLQKEFRDNMVQRCVKKYNAYSDMLTDEYGSYYIGYCSNTNKQFYVDADDFDKVKDLCWSEHHPKENFSTLIAFNTSTKKKVKMHQLLGFNGYDHIDRNELNNRKYNLRLCTQQENIVNKSKRSDNTSGVTGVSWNKQLNKWYAELSYEGARWRKCFDNFDDAVKARLEAEVQYFGDFAPQKHLFEQYEINY